MRPLLSAKKNTFLYIMKVQTHLIVLVKHHLLERIIFHFQKLKIK